MEKKSFVKTMNFMMWIQVITVSVLLVLFAVSTYFSAAKETNSVEKNFLNIYAAQIENRLEKIYTQLSTIVSEREDMLLLEAENENERYYASIRLAEFMKDIMRLDQSADIFVIAEAAYDTCLDANNGSVLYIDKEAIRKYFMEIAKGEEQPKGWEFQKIGDKNYLYRALKSNHRVAAAVVSVDSLLNTIPDVKFNNCAFVLTDNNGEVEGYAGAHHFAEDEGIPLEELPLSGKFCNKTDLADSGIMLYSFGNKSEVFRHLYGNAVIILFIILLLFLFDFNFMKIERMQIIVPMGEMVSGMKKIQAGDYELRYPDCLFYFISIPKELEEWKIPQMLIHTLIENEYKYAVSQDSSLMVLIKAATELHEGEEMLVIEVEDDGKGYPQEVLEYMNHDMAKRKQDGTRVGLWSIKRLLELMYDRKNLMEISNVQPHGALNKIYIPKVPVNERSKEYLEEHGIQ